MSADRKTITVQMLFRPAQSCCVLPSDSIRCSHLDPACAAVVRYGFRLVPPPCVFACATASSLPFHLNFSFFPHRFAPVHRMTQCSSQCSTIFLVRCLSVVCRPSCMNVLFATVP